LEQEVAASHLKGDELHCRLNDLEDRHEALSCAGLDTVRVVRLEGHLFPDHLRSLPRQVRDAVALGVRRGAANPLASGQVRFSWDLDRLEPEFLKVHLGP
jgi:hypothetical protein